MKMPEWLVLVNEEGDIWHVTGHETESAADREVEVGRDHGEVVKKLRRIPRTATWTADGQFRESLWLKRQREAAKLNTSFRLVQGGRDT